MASKELEELRKMYAKAVAKPSTPKAYKQSLYDKLQKIEAAEKAGQATDRRARMHDALDKALDRMSKDEYHFAKPPVKPRPLMSVTSKEDLAKMSAKGGSELHKKKAGDGLQPGDRVTATPIKGTGSGTIKGVVTRTNASGQVVVESGGREHAFHPSNVRASDSVLRSRLRDAVRAARTGDAVSKLTVGMKVRSPAEKMPYEVGHVTGLMPGGAKIEWVTEPRPGQPFGHRNIELWLESDWKLLERA